MKGDKISALGLVLSLVLVLVLSSCGGMAGGGETDGASADSEAKGASDEAQRSVFAMDTYMTVKAYGENAEDACDAAIAEITRLDNLFSVGIEDSDVSLVNKNGGGEVSEDTKYLISRSLDIYEQTDGKFDISIYPVMDLWGFTTQDYHVPSEEELKDKLSLVDASKISIEEGEVSFEKDGMQIDLGGIAKGYTSSGIMDIFDDYGVESGLVSLGGNVHLKGKKQDGSPWKVAIQNPDETQDYLAVLEAGDVAVITSGGYERYFEEDGKTYHHILDPETGYPADSGILSATVVTADGTLADALTTSIYIMGTDEAIEYWKASEDDFDMILYTDDGKLYVTEGIYGSITSPAGAQIVEVSR